MKLWTCISCGAVERLTIYPDACSSCGGAMTCEDDRTTLCGNDDLAERDYDLLDAAAEGDRAANVILWHQGAPDCDYSPEMIAELALQNRIHMMQMIYGAAA